ncbi:hypothetical protein D3C84_973970 [compost metagenome]
MERQAGAEHLLFGDPNQPWRNGVGPHPEVHRHFVATVVAQGIGLVVTDEKLRIQARGRHRAGHVVFRAHRIGGTAAFGGVNADTGGRQQAQAGTAQMTGTGRSRYSCHSR